jgi:hypothetical protein
MPSIRSRLSALERQRLPSMMLGSVEVHCLQGSPDSAGEHCQEHQGCKVEKTPTLGTIRRVYLLRGTGGLL